MVVWNFTFNARKYFRISTSPRASYPGLPPYKPMLQHFRMNNDQYLNKNSFRLHFRHLASSASTAKSSTFLLLLHPSKRHILQPGKNCH
ncbi:hypothetical protein PsorP6_008629 [Peronosclerospora sorghi]|uniref:Uncharacterized protein n=1 Tax=Peronosclerospora sorghi TaxID=230839 RepID=A0ACC0WAC9_9STRA|nr:hypothetical protein PsorP6_008629 [Peronosclerospora sorghi]